VDTSSLKSPEEKLRIVLAVLGGTVSLAEAARQEQVSATTVRRWRDQFMAGGSSALGGGPVEPPEVGGSVDGRPSEDARTPQHAAGEPTALELPYVAPGEAGTRRYLEALRDHWVLVALVVLVGVGSALIYAVAAPKRYDAGADILVTPISPTNESLLGFDLPQQATDPTSSVLTAARLVKNPQMADAVRSRLHLAMSRRALLDAISVQPVSQANILSIGATASTASQSARIANAVAEEFMRQRQQQFQGELVRRLGRLERVRQGLTDGSGNAAELAAIQAQIATLTPLLGAPDPTLHIAARAVPPYSPSSPRPVLGVAVGLFGSLLLGLGAVLGLEVLRPRINREDELVFVHRLPVLARVPQLRRRQVHDYLAGRGELPDEAWDAYRRLRANLATAGPGGRFPRTILMTSAIRGEGKTMGALNLAITLAATGARVIVVDGDLRRPMLATVFGVPSRGEGFADVFMNDAPVDRALVPAPGHGGLIRLVLGGAGDPNLADRLDRRRVEGGLERLRHAADVVIVDSAALTEVADALIFAGSVEAVLVVTRLGHSRPDELSELRRMLAFRGISPTGFIVTGRRLRRGRGSHDSARARTSGRIVGPVSEAAQARAVKADAGGRA